MPKGFRERITPIFHRSPKAENDLNNLVELALTKFGKLDVIVNNAGISQLFRIDELDVEGWEDMIDVNIKGALYGIASAMPVFKKQGYGHIMMEFPRPHKNRILYRPFYLFL